MIVIPAIDLKDGQCVRLRQGRADDVTVYGSDPVEVAQRWGNEGASMLHIVDLDGAFDGKPAHADVIRAIAAQVTIPIQVGGGIRTDAHIKELLDSGAYRAILGTRASEDPAAVQSMAAQYGSRLAVSIDARDGKVQVKGWVETTETEAIDLARQMDSAGVSALIYTDISRDGMMSGPNLEAIATLCDAVNCQVIASGGVTTTDDIAALRELGKQNMEGVIVGKALYEGTVTLREALA
jgi:phosphoribosylformimino-5-aminoimidazole carboxamide ribotide isomerase